MGRLNGDDSIVMLNEKSMDLFGSLEEISSFIFCMIQLYLVMVSMVTTKYSYYRYLRTIVFDARTCQICDLDFRS